MKKDIYQEVTNSIIEQLETGTVPWVKPWSSLDGGVPMNFSTKKHYSGINTLLLWCNASVRGFDHDSWLTYKQAQDMGGQVIKGAKSQRIVKVGQFTKEDKQTGKEVNLGYLKAYNVFNIAEIEGLDISENEQINNNNTDANCELLIANTGAKIIHGRGRACFIPKLDQIEVPAIELFKSSNDYYATLLHELTHWTGHKSRLHRDMTGRFGTESYAAEELVAEIGAAFLCAQNGINGQLQHASYIDTWLRLLKGDKKAIFTAASMAQKATEFINQLSNQTALAA